MSLQLFKQLLFQSIAQVSLNTEFIDLLTVFDDKIKIEISLVYNSKT